MKVLTIKEPWASLIIEGYKKYEFRSWKTNYRGKILIHTSKKIEKDMLPRFKDYNINCNSGAIIGEATLVDCIKVDDKFQKELLTIDSVVYGRSNHVENYAWKLENIIKYDNPIKAKGKLGLWNYSKVHHMNLHNDPFLMIKSGVKTIEMRLNDEKRRQIEIGDTIEFENRVTKETLQTLVIGLHKFDDFKNLYDKFSKEKLGYLENEIAKPSDMEIYYPKEKQNQYGVLAIEIKVK